MRRRRGDMPSNNTSVPSNTSMESRRVALVDVNGRVAVPPPKSETASKTDKEVDMDRERRLRVELYIPDDDPKDVAALGALGVPAELIADISREPRFGPRAGLSDARRLLRALRFGLAPGTLLERYALPADDLFG
uniref:Uncharacterized protein n=1 Tax=Haptolina brevifila TaxID=156173 RepID=A0A7S2N4Y8_9EUKA|mmetsp:Transcript_66359/g.131552  ORF Transcript_66359/g.131552 Transcript_66359/m.131552 type:complete len:135 (+) Transcript_66359:14-418(+)